MARGASGSALGNQFDDFLFASVRDDANQPLSVLSALARLDLDPWQMAAKLAALPKTAAAQTLASMFADLPDCPADREAVARHLVAFLPNQSGAQVAPTVPTAPGSQPAAPSFGFMLICVVSVLAMLSVQIFLENRPSPAPAPEPATPALGKTLASPAQANVRH
jgi:hypothetical protein